MFWNHTWKTEAQEAQEAQEAEESSDNESLTDAWCDMEIHIESEREGVHYHKYFTFSINMYYPTSGIIAALQLIILKHLGHRLEMNDS